MRYRALFVGGPIDGQERVLDSLSTIINVPVMITNITACGFSRRVQPGPASSMLVTYTLQYSHTCGEVQTLLYSVFESSETFDRLWSRYAGEDHVSDAQFYV